MLRLRGVKNFIKLTLVEDLAAGGADIVMRKDADLGLFVGRPGFSALAAWLASRAWRLKRSVSVQGVARRQIGTAVAPDLSGDCNFPTRRDLASHVP